MPTTNTTSSGNTKANSRIWAPCCARKVRGIYISIFSPHLDLRLYLDSLVVERRKRKHKLIWVSEAHDHSTNRRRCASLVQLDVSAEHELTARNLCARARRHRAQGSGGQLQRKSTSPQLPSRLHLVCRR